MIGRTIKQYRVEEPLGQGGMGVVYRARDTRLDRSVALKFLAPEATLDTERKQRFLHEARTAGKLTHPAIAQIYDVDEADGEIFIAMELVPGKTVRTLLRGKELDLLGALEIAVQVGNGLAKAHEAGIVHRDIKAENIIVTPDGHAKILDFGLAKLLDPVASGPAGSADEISHMETIAKTQAGLVMGTLRYMSPEQARGQAVDQRSDIFSLGVVLYEMVTGQVPFDGKTPLDTLHAIAFEETRPVTALRAYLPPSLQRVVSRALRKRPEDRYPDAKEMVGDLKTVQREVESGVSTAVPLKERIREGLRSLRDVRTSQWLIGLGLVAGAVVVLSAVNSGAKAFWDFGFLAFIGLIVYRRVRNRRQHLMRKFCGRVKKLPEVRIVTVDGQQVTVVADKALAKTYVRVNAALDAVNTSMFFGDPFSVVVRDGLTSDDERGLLSGPGVVYVRRDVLEGPA
jgi:eukaryotic-like serine/threonine-protein kinase